MSKSLDVSTAGTDSTVDEIVETIAGTATAVREAIAAHREYVGSENPSGEAQLEADVRADKLFEERLLGIDEVATYASEEREEVSKSDGSVHVTMDPLDGSSNLEPNAGMGSIFGVYDYEPPTVGRNLLAAGFIVYGPVTTMVVARDGHVREFVIHGGTATLVEDDLTIPADPTVYGFGGGVDSWPEDFGSYAEEIQEELKLRYGGAMIADVNQVLTYGGIFSYPALDSAPEGKLRLQFEGQPMAYVVETAGGKSSNGERSLLDAHPDELHERTPVHLGNQKLIERLETELD